MRTPSPATDDHLAAGPVRRGRRTPRVPGVPDPRARWWRTRLLAVVSGLALVALGGCALPGGPPDDGDPRPRVLTTFTVIADMTREVAGDRVRVDSVTRPGMEIHGYEPTPGDLTRGADADLILDNGLGLEAWFERFLDRAGTPSATLSEGVETLPIADGAEAGAPNPHAWMSPDNAVVYVENIRDALVGLDPAGEATYRANAQRYAAELSAVGDELRAALAVLPANQRALVTCEGAFSYLARDVGLTEAYLWPVNSDVEGTPQQVASTVTFVRENAVPAVFCESTVNDGAQQRVAAETGARLGPPLYVDSLSGPEGRRYFRIFTPLHERGGEPLWPGFRREATTDWLAPLEEGMRSIGRPELARVVLAVIRGLLMDLDATGEAERVDAAFAAFLGVVRAA